MINNIEKKDDIRGLTLSEYIKDFRRRKALTLNDVAKLLGVSTTLIFKCEKGKSQLPIDSIYNLDKLNQELPDKVTNEVENVPEFIKNYLEKNGYTSSDLAQKLGVRRQTVKRWLDGKNRPDDELLEKIKRLETEELQKETIISEYLNGKTPSEFILFVRKRKKLSQSELAEKLGVKLTTVNNWEKCIKTPPKEYIEKLEKLRQELPDKTYEAEYSSEFIKNFLEKNGYTMNQLAEKLGVSRQVVDNWLKGKYRLKDEFLKKIKALEMEELQKEKTIFEYLNGKTPSEFILSVRNKKKLSQNALAEKLGVSIETLRNWEKGLKEPSKEIILLIIELDKSIKVSEASIEVIHDAEYIKNFRIRKGLTQKELAKLLNVCMMLVSNWECGRKHPREETLKRIIELDNTLPNVSEIDKDIVTKPNYLLDKSNVDDNQSLEEEIEILTTAECTVIETPLTHPLFKELIKLLPSYCRHITKLRLGLYDGKIYDFKTISELFDMSEEEVERICNEGIFRLKAWIECYTKDKNANDNVLKRKKVND